MDMKAILNYYFIDKDFKTKEIKRKLYNIIYYDKITFSKNFYSYNR